VYNGGVQNRLTLARTLVAGNTADRGREMSNHGTIFADHSNLFGVNGRAGVAGFSPGATGVVPEAGVQLADILNPTLAFNGGRTQTHALVPGSPAIDAGGPYVRMPTTLPSAPISGACRAPSMVTAMARPPVTSGPSSFPPRGRLREARSGLGGGL
jgi:hypothetical protein